MQFSGGTSIEVADIGVLDLKSNDLINVLRDKINKLIKEDFSSVIFGCTGMNFVYEKLHSEYKDKINIIEPLTTGIKTLELIIGMGDSNSIKSTPIDIKVF